MGSYLYCEYLCKKPLKYQRLFTFSYQKTILRSDTNLVLLAVVRLDVAV